MPKLKTKASAKKRFRITGSGKFKRSKAFKRHILTKKTQKRKRNLRKDKVCNASETKILKPCFPYSK